MFVNFFKRQFGETFVAKCDVFLIFLEKKTENKEIWAEKVEKSLRKKRQKSSETFSNVLSWFSLAKLLFLCFWLLFCVRNDAPTMKKKLRWLPILTLLPPKINLVYFMALF